MPWSPARKRMTAKPMYFQVMMPSRVQIASSGFGEPVLGEGAEADLVEQAVDGAVGLEHQAPAGADDDLGDDVGHEDEHPDQRLPAHRPVQQQREQERDRALQHQRQHDDDEVVPRASWNVRVLEDRDVVLQADEVGGRAVALPPEEAVVAGHDDREDDEAEEDHEGRADEHGDLEDLPPVAPAATRDRGRRVAGPTQGRGRDSSPARTSSAGARLGAGELVRTFMVREPLSPS